KIIYYLTTTTLNTPNQTELLPESILVNQTNDYVYLRNLVNQFCPTIFIQSNVNNELKRYFVIPIDKNCNSLDW
ncbi:1962_t:CDS:1, partial [Cetraspora pellucida]